MTAVSWLMGAALPVLFALSAFFSSSETVLFSLTSSQRERIRKRSREDDVLIGKCLDDKAVLFSTILVGNTFVNFLISTIGFHLLSGWIPGGGGWIAVPVMTVLLLVFGEITPKRLALRYAERLAPFCARLLRFWRLTLTPFNVVLRFTAKAFAPALERERRALSDDELVSVLESAAEDGAFASQDAEMIEGVLRLSELCANDEMTPRVDIEGYDTDTDDASRKRVLETTKHRYLPVYKRTPDAIEGVIEVATGKLEDALFVPETVTLDDLLTTFAKSRKPMAIVTDEFGGTAGIISPNDILELIVGSVATGSTQPTMKKSGDNTWEIEGGVSIDEINRELDVELEAEDADRLSGWVQFHAERIPHVGQEIEADGCKATILKRRHRRVTLVRLEVLERKLVDNDEQIIAETDEAVERTEEDDE